MNRRLPIFLFFISCVFLNSYAQHQKVKNQPYGDQRLHHFGLTVGLNFQDLILTNSGFTDENGETWFAEIPNYSPGFNVGLIADLYLNQYMNLRFSPTVYFGDKSFTFIEETSKELFHTSVRSNFLTFPLDMKVSSMRLNNYRPYIIAGAYTALNLGIKKNEPLLLKAWDYGFQIGFGCDFYLPIVKVCPEIRFYFGIPNMINHDRSDLTDRSQLKFSQALTRGVTRMIVISLNFE